MIKKLLSVLIILSMILSVAGFLGTPVSAHTDVVDDTINFTKVFASSNVTIDSTNRYNTTAKFRNNYSNNEAYVIYKSAISTIGNFELESVDQDVDLIIYTSPDNVTYTEMVEDKGYKITKLVEATSSTGWYEVNKYKSETGQIPVGTKYLKVRFNTTSVDAYKSLLSKITFTYGSGGNANYYIDANGNDSNNGHSSTSAFKTIQRAVDIVDPGDTIYIMNGTYGQTSREGVAWFTRSGLPNAYITIKPFPGHTPVLHATDGWNHILVEGASYIKIEGLTIRGNAPNITYDEAYSVYQYVINTPRDQIDWSYIDYTNTNGISIKSKNGTPTPIIPHHVEVRNCLIYDCPGGGLGTDRADYITFENNVVRDNCSRNLYAGSGISLWRSLDIDTNKGTKNFIRGNISYRNENYIPWAFGVDNTSISDGNGIIVDSNLNKDLGLPYQGKTRIENNIVYENGGSGIHAYSSRYVDIVNNTAYNNGRSPALNWGEIFANSTDYVNILNNICYARTNKNVNMNYDNKNLVYDYNVLYNGTIAVQGTNDIVADPKFESLANYNFKLLPNSQALNSGTSTLAPGADYIGTSRPQAGVVDRGAYEMKNLLLNPGFESDGANWALGNTTSAISTQDKNGGSKSLKLTKTSAWSNWVQNASATNAAAGTYTVKFWVKGSGINYANFSVQNGTTTLATAPAFHSSISSTGWTQITLTGVNVPAGANLIVGVWTQGNANGYVYYDDFSLNKE